MRGSTHVAIGVSAALWTNQPWYGVAAAALGSLLPDIDEPGSIIGSKVPGSAFGRVGRAAVGGLVLYLGIRGNNRLAMVSGAGLLALAFVPHRGITHSLLALVLAWLGAWTLAPRLAWPFAVGYALHLMADALTPAGVPLLWPWPKNVGVPLVRTSGWIDRLAGVAGWLFILSRYLKWGGR